MALELAGLHKHFGAQHALDGVSLRVAPGEIAAFVGHNGSGKTTAMRIALGLSRAEQGSVFVDGFDARVHVREARARLAGLVEMPGFHARWSARAELESLARLGGLDATRARAAADLALERVGLDPAEKKAVGSYSQGMRQRLGLAQALIASPRYLVLDEPLNGLDPEAVVELRTLLTRLAREDGVGLLVSSHQLAELAEIATHAIILRRGRVLRAAPMAELLDEPARRYRVRPRDLSRAGAVLAARGVAATPAGAFLEFDPGATPPETLARALLDEGGGFTAFAPRETTLEEIYLRVQHEPERTQPMPAPPLAAAHEPGERRAPPRPLAALVRYEWNRLAREARPAWAFGLPLAIGALALVRRMSEARADEARVAGQELFSATGVNAFEGVGVFCAAALPALALVVCGVASQSLAGELGRGTLRNALLRPVKRGQVAAGKALALACGTTLGYVVLAAGALGLAALALRFEDVSEVLPNGARFSLVPAAELWSALTQALALALAPLWAAAGVGYLAGAIASTGASALALALGAWLGLDLARVFARGTGFEAWLPGAYVPSPLSDTSVFAYLIDLSRGVSSARFEFADTALVVPLAWALLSLAVARAILVRRDVP